MKGVHFVTNTSGTKTGIIIDFDVLRQHPSSGREVLQQLSSLEDVEDIIDVELSRSEPSESWHTVKNRLKSQHRLSENV
jgi:hypothetical protein